MRVLDLSNIAGEPGDLITCTEYMAQGDGGGGTFEWFPLGHPLPTPLEDPEDGGIVLGNPTLAGRWIRQWSGHVNVRWFGAQGDGKGYDPEPDGAGDTERIQKAIDFCARYYQATEGVGGTVFFPPGIYRVSAPRYKDPHQPPRLHQAPYKLQLRSKVSLLGCGSSSVISSAGGQGLSSRTLTNYDTRPLNDPDRVPPLPRVTDPILDVTIKGLRFEDHESAQPPSPDPKKIPVERATIFVAEATNLRVLDCIFHDTADAIRLYKDCKGCRISGNEIYGNLIDISRECIIISGGQDTLVEGNSIHDCPFAFAIGFT